MASSTTPRSSLHPALWVAAVAVTLASLAAVGAIFGVIPTGKANEPQATPVAAASTPAAPLALADAAATSAQTAPPAASNDEPSTEPQSTDRPATRKPATKETAHSAHTTSAKPVSTKHPTKTSKTESDDETPTSNSRDRDVASSPAVARCVDCGTVESVVAHSEDGQGSGAGAVAGAVLGGVLGHQVGEGNGKRLARIGGAVLGGFAGHEAEKKIRATKTWDIAVRMNDGSTRHVTAHSEPAWHAGDAVRVVDDQVVSRDGATL